MAQDPPIGNGDHDRLVIPVHAETIDVSRLTRETGSVRVSTVTHIREHLVDEMLSEEHAHIRRVAVGKVVDVMPDVRQVGDTLVVPVVEEVLVVERRLFLKQEIHITRVATTSRYQETVMLREQEAIVTRSPPETLCNRDDADQDPREYPKPQP